MNEKIAEMTDQELADAIQSSIARAIRLTDHGVKRACGYAGKGAAGADNVVPPLSGCLGHLWQAHGDATAAANAMPTVAPAFGDK